MKIFSKDNILERLTIPYIFFPQELLGEKIRLSKYIHNLEDELLLIPAPSLFSYPSVIAGMSENQIEYIAKNGPSDYKNELLKSIEQKFKIKNIFEIAKAMDDDLKNGVVKNQERVNNVIQYIKDNKIAFEF